MSARRSLLVLGILALLSVLVWLSMLLSDRVEAARARAELLAVFSADLQVHAAALDAGPEPPDAENAALHYEAAYAKLRRDGAHLVAKLDREWTTPPEDLVKWVADNAAAMADAEAGAGLDACRFPFPPGQSASNWPYGPAPQMEGLPVLADLFAARARIRLHEGRTAEAVADALRVPRIVRHELLRSVHAPGDREVEMRRTIDVLDRALRRPDLDAATERSVVDGLLEWPRLFEGDAYRRRVLAHLEQTRAISFLLGHLSERSETDLRRSLRLPERGLFGRVSVEDCRLLAAHRDRWQAVRAGVPPEGSVPPWIGRLTLVRVAYAARVYERIHGRPPARLEDLVPDILKEVPRDPSGQGPLRCDWPPRLERGPR